VGKEGAKGPRSFTHPTPSILDGPLLGGVDLFPALTFQEHCLDLFVQELPGLGISGVEAMVVDQDRLMLEPIGPASFADRLMYPFTQGIPEGSLLEFGSVFLTAVTTNGIHRDLAAQVKRDGIGKIKLQEPLPPSRCAFEGGRVDAS
jgi:hypothetical protein